MKGLAVIVGLAALLLSGCSRVDSAEVAAEATRSPTVTEIDYGQQYLAIVCPKNIEGDKQKESWENLEFGVDTPQAYRKWAGDMAEANKVEAQALSDAEWPAEVQKSIDKIAVAAYDDVAPYESRANKPDPEDWDDFNDSASYGKAASDIRLKLDLPPRGEGCDAFK